MRRLPFVVALAVVLVLPGSAAGASKARDRALLASVLRGMRTDLSSVRIGKAPSVWGARHGQRFLTVIPGTTTDPGRVADDWYAMLIAGAYQAQCGKWTAHCLVAWEVKGIGGSRAQATRKPPAKVNAYKLAQTIRARFARQGLHVSSVSYERPYGLAPIVTVTSRHPQRAVTAFYTSAPLSRLPIEGFLVRMVDRRDRVFLADGGSLRIVQGTGWTRRGLKVPNEK